jgi:hypothetical protein
MNRDICKMQGDEENDREINMQQKKKRRRRN